MNNPNTLTLKDFIFRFKKDIKDVGATYKGFIISNLSMPFYNRNCINSYNNSYFIEAQNEKHIIKLLVNKQIIDSAIASGFILNEEVSVDIVINTIDIDSRGVLLITISSISESGISEQEIFNRGLDKYCVENDIYNRNKKSKPSLIKKIALISTLSSTTSNDITKNLKYSDETILYNVFSSSGSIAEQIIKCQEENFDIILLYRGGHEDKAMNIYSDIEVIKAICNSTIHIGVALGHETDTPFIYKIADSTYSTPTHFAQIVNEYNTLKCLSFDDTTSEIARYIKNINNTLRKELETFKISDTNLIRNKFQKEINYEFERCDTSIDVITINLLNKISISNERTSNLIDTIVNDNRTMLSRLATSINIRTDEIKQITQINKLKQKSRKNLILTIIFFVLLLTSILYVLI